MTESDELAAALDAATQRWPGVSRGRLVVLLALEGGARLHEEGETARRERLARLHEHAGAGTGAYGAGYLDEVRDGWPG